MKIEGILSVFMMEGIFVSYSPLNVRDLGPSRSRLMSR
jgi:hypothetical protein